MAEPRIESDKKNGKIDSIEIMMKSDVVCSNPNRVAILHLLKRNPRKEMQAEKLAQALGVSHRTALYHLDVLENYELVKVSGFRKKGKKMLRSVWGLNVENDHVEKILSVIYKKFPPEKVRKIIKSNGFTNGYAR